MFLFVCLFLAWGDCPTHVQRLFKSEVPWLSQAPSDWGFVSKVERSILMNGVVPNSCVQCKFRREATKSKMPEEAFLLAISFTHAPTITGSLLVKLVL